MSFDDKKQNINSVKDVKKENIKLRNVLGTPKLKQKYKNILGDLYLNLILTYLKIFRGILRHFMIDPVLICHNLKNEQKMNQVLFGSIFVLCI